MRRFQEDNMTISMTNCVKSWDLFPNFETLFTECCGNRPDNFGLIAAGSKSTIGSLSQELLSVLRMVYTKLYPDHSNGIQGDEITISTTFHKYSYIMWHNIRLSSLTDSTRSSTHPYFMAKPLFHFSPGTTTSDYDGDSKLCEAQYFLKHSIALPNRVEAHLFVFCSWPSEHSSRFSIGKPVEVWNEDIFETVETNSFLPVEKITDAVIVSSDELTIASSTVTETVLVVTPISV